MPASSNHSGSNHPPLADHSSAELKALKQDLMSLQLRCRELEEKLALSQQQYAELQSELQSLAIGQKVHRNLPQIEDVRSRQEKDQKHSFASTDSRVESALVTPASYTRVEGLGCSTVSTQKDSNVQATAYESPAQRAYKDAMKQSSCESQPALADDIEKNFTKAGLPGKLGCPFAVSNANGSVQFPQISPPVSSHHQTYNACGHSEAPPSKRLSFSDPIRAEICGVDLPSASASAFGSGPPLCPIRFLNQHPPEEVAKYFEKHKHELPRSHEICVKRYQSNAESIRQLDAKYGNLVSMIQGLGVKHQSILKDKLASEETTGNHNKQRKEVELWANAVSEDMQRHNEELQESPGGGEQLRRDSYEKPLREIRVGESPSRPWGIVTPSRLPMRRASSLESYANTAGSEAPETHSRARKEKEPKGGLSKCPFDNSSKRKNPPKAGSSERRKSRATDRESATKPDRTKDAQNPVLLQREKEAQTNDRGRPQMLFTGPVFIGYSAEESLTLLKRYGSNTNPDLSDLASS